MRRVYSNLLVGIALEAEGRRGVTKIPKSLSGYPMVRLWKISSVK